MVNLDEMLAEEEELHNTPPNDDNDDTSGDDNDGSTPPDDTGDSDDKPASDPIDVDETAEAYFNYLKEVEVLDVPEDFEFKGDAASIQEALSLTKKNLTTKVAQSIWQSLPEDFKPLLEYGLSGGKNLKDYLEAVKTVDIETLDLEDDISRRSVIKSYYRILSPKLTDEQLNKRVDKLSEIGDLEEEAQDALEYLKTHRQEKQTELVSRAQAQRDAELQAYQNELKTVTKVIEDSSEFDTNRKNRLKSFLFTPTSENTTGFDAALDAIYENPNHKVQLANILADYDPKVGFNFQKLQTKLQTKATQTLKELMNSKLDPKGQTKSGGGKQPDEDFDFGKWFNN